MVSTISKVTFSHLISSEEVDWNKIADGTCDKVYVPEMYSREVETEVALVPYASLVSTITKNFCFLILN